MSISLSNGTLIDTDKCVAKIGNRYDLVLVASIRTRELRRGHTPKVGTKDRALTSALREIQDGHISKDYLKRVSVNKR